ncbi:MAG: 16S rRNA (guanine(527)-N(7))-methyltransferase RsmG [Bacilli bacterium]|nr:16S rRNA (guanine(527)-N(7))-methyltransferase RsmG [Bacilli bacterium]
MNYEELKTLTSQFLPLSDSQIEAFKKYAVLLREWNAKFNLTAITEESEVVEKHFYDCLLPFKSIKFENINAIDLGSGAGFPGLVFAIAMPTWNITLVDSTNKKCTFLKEAAKELGLTNVTVINARAEELGMRGQFDLVSARAVAPLYLLLELAMPLLKVNGTFLSMKGSKAEEEIKEAKDAFRKLDCKVVSMNTESLPNDVGTRSNIVIKKIKETNKKYPRTWGEMQKHHL